MRSTKGAIKIAINGISTRPIRVGTTELNSGQRPTWQGGFRVDGTDAEDGALRV